MTHVLIRMIFPPHQCLRNYFWKCGFTTWNAFVVHFSGTLNRTNEMKAAVFITLKDLKASSEEQWIASWEGESHRICRCLHLSVVGLCLCYAVWIHCAVWIHWGRITLRLIKLSESVVHLATLRIKSERLKVAHRLCCTVRSSQEDVNVYIVLGTMAQ